MRPLITITSKESDHIITFLISFFQLNLAFKENSDAVFDLDVKSQEEMDSILGTFVDAVRTQMKDNERLRTRMLALVKEGDGYGYFD